MNIASLSPSCVSWYKYCRKLVIKHLITKLINTQLRTFFCEVVVFIINISCYIILQCLVDQSFWTYLWGKHTHFPQIPKTNKQRNVTAYETIINSAKQHSSFELRCIRHIEQLDAISYHFSRSIQVLRISYEVL